MMRRGATARFCKEGGGFGRIGVVVVSVCCKLVGFGGEKGKGIGSNRVKEHAL